MTQDSACKQSKSIDALILAGGQARRMHGDDKGLLNLQGQTLSEHVIDRLSDQVEGILVNANRNHKQYAEFGYDVFSDEVGNFAGPLAGMLSGMKKSTADYLLVVPCDSPCIPLDLVERLQSALAQNDAEIAVVHDGERLQPVFALIDQSLENSLDQFLKEGGRKIDRWYGKHAMVKVDFSDQAEAFINVNTPEELNRLEMQLTLDTLGVPVLGFIAHSGSGKTTLLKKLIPCLRARGLRLGLVKHAHHDFEIDVPGKDSYELRIAGATQVIVGSQKRWALMVETPDREETLTLASLIRNLHTQELDLVLIEGFKLENIPKIEVFRPTLGKLSLADASKGFLAIATDEPESISSQQSLPCLDLNDLNVITDFVVEYRETWLSGSGDNSA